MLQRFQNFGLKLILILILIISSVASNKDTKINNISQDCDIEIPNDCNSPWEECGDEGKCICKKQFHFYEEKNECVGFIGNSCYDQENNYLGCVKNGNCYKNSSIEGEGICICPKNYIPGYKNEICLGGHLESCESNSDCYYIGLLECNAENKKCECPANSRWEPDSDKGPRCRVTLGGNCDISNPGEEFGLECSTSLNLACYDGKCECFSVDFKPYKDGCYVALGRGCNNSNVCHPQFYCSNTKKVCMCGPSYEVNEKGECTGLSNAECLYEEVPLWECTENSQCSEEGLCSCNEPNYTVGFFSKCFKTYDQECSTNYDCNVKGFLECSETSNRCACEEGFEYEANFESVHFGKCLAEYGISCPRNDYNGTEGFERLSTCMGGAYCATNKCACSDYDGHNPHNDKCYISYSYKCKKEGYPYEICNPSKFLKCSDFDETCDCQDGFFYNWNGGYRCVGRIGTQCKFPEGYEALCTDHAHCKEQDGQHICQCNEDFHYYADGNCHANLYTNCEDQKHVCNPYRYHNCVDYENTKICQCDPYNTFYDEDLEICRFKLETSCDKRDEFYENITCIENASCGGEQGRCICNAGFHKGNFNDGFKCYSKLGTQCQETPDCVTNNSTCLETNKGKVCSCSKGFSLDPFFNDDYENSTMSLCFANYGIGCVYNDNCNKDKFLTCNRSQNKCDCEDPYYFHEPSKDKCVASINSYCKSENRETYCPPNASCIESDQCRCNDGYIHDREDFYPKKCYARHGKSCMVNDDCFSKDMLVCSNNTCGCAENFVYDSELNMCLGLVGTFCEFSEFTACVEGAYCIDKHCDCGSDTHKVNPVKKDKRCYPLFGRSCLQSDLFDKCNTWENLACYRDTCECRPPLHYYDYECRSYYEGECDIESSLDRKQIKCTNNLVCTPNNNSTVITNIGICQCEKGYEVDYEKTRCSGLYLNDATTVSHLGIILITILLTFTFII